MNFTKLSLILVPIGLVLIGWLYFGAKTDPADPISVATAFTKAFKTGDMEKASAYFLPAKADAWREATDKVLNHMKSGANRNYLEAVPSKPAFAAVAPRAGAPANAELMSLRRSDGYVLELSRVTGKWWVSKAPV